MILQNHQSHDMYNNLQQSLKLKNSLCPESLNFIGSWEVKM